MLRTIGTIKMLSKRKYIDIGANLTDLMYTGVYNKSKKHEEDLSSVLKRSWDVGLEKMIITGGNYEESCKALEMTKTDERLFSTVGCHPTRCLEFESEGETPDNYLDKLRSLITNNQKNVVAIGECGLDYDRTQFCPIEIQQKYFEKQLILAEETKLPLFLHCRNAADDFVKVIEKFTGLEGVVHSFDGTLEEAEKFINLGYYIGINGCSLKTKDNLETVKALPVEKLLIETDCPWCEIRPSHAGYSMIAKEHFFESVKKEKWNGESMVKSRNEPANILHVLDVIAAIKNQNVDELADQIYKNTIDLFFVK